MTTAEDLAARLAELDRLRTAPLPTAEQTTAWGAEDRALVPRIRAIQPGVPAHHVLAVLTALRAIRHLEAQPDGPIGAALRQQAEREQASREYAARRTAAPLPDVQGRCPACRATSLFLADGGYVTCSRIDCPDPEAVTKVLEQDTAADRLREELRQEQDLSADLRARLKATSDACSDATLALAQLHAGEEEPADRHADHTPAQWMWQWNRATPEERLDMAGRILAAFETADTCFVMNHKGEAPRRQAAEQALGRVHTELDRIAALPTVDRDETRADTFSTGANWTLKQIRAALDETQEK
ncbi:DUF6085 family protein [Streptomyces xanthophaeus]|uniref:DUF6085 family protein n=1 Tax=Streptomyces xanthophaeus TaxID=67385 RepID=UPI00365A18D5